MGQSQAALGAYLGSTEHRELAAALCAAKAPVVLSGSNRPIGDLDLFTQPRNEKRMSDDDTTGPRMVHFDPQGDGLLFRGHDIEPATVECEWDRAYGPVAVACNLATERLFLREQRLVRSCGRDGDPCDLEGDWHTHWHPVQPAETPEHHFTFAYSEMTADPAAVAADQPALRTQLNYLPEREIISMLARQYGEVRAGARRYATASHVPSAPMNATKIRVCDFMALDCWKGRDTYPLHGFEIKASRGDWLAELRKPEKAEAFKGYCHRWWLVVSDERIVRDGELPDDWGMLAVDGQGLKVIQPAPKLTAEPMPWSMIAALARAIAKTARALEMSPCPHDA